MHTRYSTFAILLVFACVIAGPLAAQQSQEPEVLVLVPKSTSSIPMLLVEALDAETNIVSGGVITVEFFGNHPQALARLLRGEATALLTGTSQGWENHLAGGPVVMVNTGVWGVSSMVSLDEEISSPEDLAGKRVAMPFPGAPLDVQMRHIWSSVGIDPDRDLEISFSAPTQTVGFLMTGKIDAAPLPEPLATNLVQNRGLTRCFEIPAAWAAATGGDAESPQVSLFSTRRRVDDRTPVLGALVTAWREASSLVTADPERYGAQFADELGLPEAVVVEALGFTMLSVPSYGDNVREVREYFEIVRSVYPETRPGLNSAFFADVE